MELNRVVLEPMRLSDAKRLPRAAYVQRNAEVSLSDDVEGLLLRIDSHVLAHRYATGTERHLIATDTFSSPASPWQHFKANHEHSWWLGWLVRRRPPVMTTQYRRYEATVTIGRHVTFPECGYQFPDVFGRPVVVDTVDVSQEVTGRAATGSDPSR